MSEVKTIRFAMAGLGTVGGGVAEIVVNRAEALENRTGLRFEIVKALVSDATKQRDVPCGQDVYTTDATDLASVEADMLVEVMGGTDRSRQVVLAALSRGIPVVTANKALLAHHGVEIYKAARAAKTCIAFEASCAGGLPIIGALLRGLQANHNTSIMGIFNSTCNYILSEMLSGGAAYDAALKSAQELGYAEADPTLDVGGGDTAHKLTILASLAFGLNLDGEKVATEGINGVELRDLQIAQKMGYACKMLGIGRRVESLGRNGVCLSAHPTLVPNSNTLSGMDGTSGAVAVEGDVVGETFYAGAGAGSLPTASAVVADMIDVASGAAQQTFDQIRTYNDRTVDAVYRELGDREFAYYVRGPGDALNEMKSSNLDWQRLDSMDEDRAVIGITNSMCERAFKGQYAALQAAVSHPPTFIRLLPEKDA